jgi:ADP-heptose:LPS heptosyltransferase
VQGITLVNLQTDADAAARAVFGDALIDWSGELRDFADTAALIANLDLVVSVDTSVVHCAGAIGAPVWMLDRFDHCWRWGGVNAEPGWYSTLRIFRQPSFGDWDGALVALQAALRAWARDYRS